MSIRPVWVIQNKSSGLFLGNDLFLTRSLRDAGRCEDVEAALDTAISSLETDFEIHMFYETEQVIERRFNNDI